ncbi:MAG: hypothetical protein QG574_1379 [Cyanobacteriota bacterium erpe_2018_sw_21hr_WHONDRS-SW48-000092_B_bin.40]|jgi:hypothetical protein|nr:hypothetical protein [Cyanobacteriota bacterium erpe_2018_sw_21hr_WHONDRS-SW48-000092_B_bin.40]
MFATKKHIAGTEGTHNYVVICQTSLGLVAVRHLNDGTYRVRVEPSNDEASAALAKALTRNIFVDPSWKQPFDQGANGQNRFSTVVNGDELHTAVAQAVTALSGNGDVDGEPGTSSWEAALNAVAAVGSTDRAELIARLRDNGTPGVNSASRWTTTTLVEKAFIFNPNN